MLQGAAHSQQRDGTAPEGKAPRPAGLVWLLALLMCTIAVAVSFAYLDVPIARHVEGMLGSAKSLANGLTSAVLLSGEAVVALTLVVLRITRGRLSPVSEAAALACLTSICAYAINDGILKLFFGVSNPAAVLQGAAHAFSWLHGASSSSFPSGHMVLSGAFAGVFIRLCRKSLLPLSALLLLGAILLIVGDWHFVSDVVAGIFVGVSAGLLAGEVWLAHSNRTPRPW